MRDGNLGRRLAATAMSIALMTTACSFALAPRTTIEGRPFGAEQVAAVRPGQTAEEVRSLLGEPYELLKAGDIDTWRYYERFEPRGCEQPKPVITREFKVLFRAGTVIRTEPAPPGPQATP